MILVPASSALFVLEAMMHEISVRTIAPVAIATTMATYVGRLWFGPHPSFVVPGLEVAHFHATDPYVLLSYAGLGVLIGGVAALFIRSIYGTEDFFEKRIGGSYYRKHGLGMLLVGLVIYALLATQGYYYVDGVGYSTVQDILAGTPLTLTLLVTLFALKLLATSLTLGSGASGGIFSPALFLGATFGAGYALAAGWLFPGVAFSVPAFALAGMAGLVGSATSAAMAAIVMIFEMMLDYNVIIPMTITVAISCGVRRVLCRDSIYTKKLVRRGHFLPEALRTRAAVRPARQRDQPRQIRPAGRRDHAGGFRARGLGGCVRAVLSGGGRGQTRRLRAPHRRPRSAARGPRGRDARRNRRPAFLHDRRAVLALQSHQRDAPAGRVARTRGRGQGHHHGVINRERVADAVIESAELFRD